MYGLSENDLKYVQEKINSQKKYLKDSTFVTGQGQVKTLLDVSFSANHSVRYYAQLVNKVNTMTDFAKSIGHVPIFMSPTLDGFFRDFQRGDFRRFQKLSIDDQQTALRSIPNNDQYGYLRDKIKDQQPFSPKDCYNVLNYQTKRFFMSYTFKKMRKHGVKYDYIRAVEPHEDGTPHLHILLFVPTEYVDGLKDEFTNNYPAPHNKQPLKGDSVGQLECFQWIIHNAAGYVMKYVTKSFRDVKNDADLDYLQAWYIKHRITRVSSSRSVVPQWVYQKIVPLEKDWYHLTELLRTDTGRCEWSKEDDYILLHDNDFNRSLEYDRGLYKIFYGDKIIKEFGQIREKFSIDRYEAVPSQWVDHSQDTHNHIEVYIDETRYFTRNGQLSAWPKKPYQMTKLELYTYFHSLDIESVDLYHYGLVRNMMINKNMLTGEMINPSEFTKEYFDNDRSLLINVPQGVNLGDYLEATEVF